MKGHRFLGLMINVRAQKFHLESGCEPGARFSLIWGFPALRHMYSEVHIDWGHVKKIIAKHGPVWVCLRLETVSVAPFRLSQGFLTLPHLPLLPSWTCRQMIQCPPHRLFYNDKNPWGLHGEQEHLMQSQEGLQIICRAFSVCKKEIWDQLNTSSVKEM